MMDAEANKAWRPDNNRNLTEHQPKRANLTLLSKSAKLAKSAKLSPVALSPQPPPKGSVVVGLDSVLVGLLLELICGGGGLAGLVLGGAGLGGGCLDFLGGRAGVGLSGRGGGPPPPPALNGSLPNRSLAPCRGKRKPSALYRENESCQHHEGKQSCLHFLCCEQEI